MSFIGRLVAGTVAVLVLTIGLLLLVAGRTLRDDLEGDLARSLETEARLVEAALPEDASRWAETLRRLGQQSGHRAFVADRDGRLLAADPAAAADHLPADVSALPEVRAALATGTGADLRRPDAASPPELNVAVAFDRRVVHLAAPLDAVERTMRSARGALLGAAVLALLVGSLLAWLAGRTVAQPLTALTQATRAIAQGTLPRFPRSGIPDVDALVQAVRQMHRQLDERFHELTSEQAASAALVDAMVEGVIAADGRGRITTANPAARRLLGYAPGQALPDLRELFRAKAAREVVDRVLAGEPVQDRQLELDGRTVLVSARPLGSDGAMLVLHDVTEVRRLEAVRRDFVANVSHELKTPLTSISGYAETLLQDVPDAETTRRFLAIIVSNARRMQRLVDDLLDLSRIEAGRWQPRPEPVDVGAVVREVWATLAERAAQRGVAFTMDVPPDAATLVADPDAVRQVLTNLLDNSLRYTAAGGTIAARSRARDGGIELSVADDGAGIAREHLPRIFERFYRVDASRSREEGGTGLGLSIVKHLLEAHGGRVAAESELGRGTLIRCWFPAPIPD